MTKPDLKTALRLAKSREQAAKNDRLAIEVKIYNLYKNQLKVEGTNKVDGFKIVTGFTRTWDNTRLKDIAEEIKPEFFPFKPVFKEDVRLSKAIKQANPELWDRISPALTLKPKKPSITILED